MSTSAPPKNALIIGVSRGLGLGLARELLTRGWHVTGTVRGAAKGSGLDEFHGQVRLDTVDINNQGTVSAFLERIKHEVFDVAFINAGVSGPVDASADNVSSDEVNYIFTTNAISPVRLAGKLLPLVRRDTGILAFMTSGLGSVEGNVHATMPIYSASKAALNHLSRSFVAGLGDENITVLNIHPGWVRTDMGGEHADIDVATSVRGIADVLEAKAGAGGQEFLNYKGETLPW
jgi:NAD(P)-dependent dehydrogenase (short-subunit alcohol dehydrogenase family)